MTLTPELVELESRLNCWSLCATGVTRPEDVLDCPPGLEDTSLAGLNPRSVHYIREGGVEGALLGIRDDDVGDLCIGGVGVCDPHLALFGLRLSSFLSGNWSSFKLTFTHVDQKDDDE